MNGEVGQRHRDSASAGMSNRPPASERKEKERKKESNVPAINCAPAGGRADQLLGSVANSANIWPFFFHMHNKSGCIV